MKSVRSGLRKWSDKAASIAGLLIILLMLTQFVIVIFRYLFAIGVSWGLDLLSYLFMVASLLPLIQVIITNLNVRVDIFYQDYQVETKSRLDRLALALLIVPVCAYTAYISWPSVANSWRLFESSPTLGGLPGYFLLKTLQLLTFTCLALAAFSLSTRKQPWDYEKSVQVKDGESS